MFEHDEQQKRDDGHRDVAGRPRERGDDVVAPNVPEVAQGDGTRLGPPDEPSAIEHADERDQYGTKGVQVLRWIESYTTEHVRGGVAETHRSISMGTFVHAECKDQDEDLEQDQDDFLAHTSQFTGRAPPPL